MSPRASQEQGATGEKRVALYARVSTARQADADVSVPDQRKQGDAWCERTGHKMVRQYIESGSGTDESRPVFSQMLDDAKTLPRLFDVILVHSFSRFCRDNFTYSIAKVTLKKAGVSIESITQPLSDDPTGAMVESIIVAFDSYTSAEISKHTSRAMRENARQGFFNGSRPPFGYSAVEAERRGEKVKKKLVVNNAEAIVVRQIYDLYIGADGIQRGVKSIASFLNIQGVRFRSKPFMISNVHRVLTSQTYAGRHLFNLTNSETGQARPEREWILVEVPPIIQEEMWQNVQRMLAERSPKKTPARVVNSPILLAGIAVCGFCGAGMTLRTGKSYRYYACAGRAQQGPTRCHGCAVPIPKVDNAVLTYLIDHVFVRDRLIDLVTGYLIQSKAEAQEMRNQIGRLKSALTETDSAIDRLLAMVEAGVMDAKDSALTQRLSPLKSKRVALASQIKTATEAVPAPSYRLTETKLDSLSAEIRRGFASAAPELQKAYLKLFVNQVIVSKIEIKICGPKGSSVRLTI